MSTEPVLLSIVELGGYPDFTAVYEQSGYEVVKANSMRKALAVLKKQTPAVIVAEFIYGPTYGSQLSNFESLFAALQSAAGRHTSVYTTPAVHLIALMDKHNRQHFDKLKSRFPTHKVFYFPISAKELKTHLAELNSGSQNPV